MRPSNAVGTQTTRNGRYARVTTIGMKDVVTVLAEAKPIWVIRVAAYHPDGTMPRGEATGH